MQMIIGYFNDCNKNKYYYKLCYNYIYSYLLLPNIASMLRKELSNWFCPSVIGKELFNSFYTHSEHIKSSKLVVEERLHTVK